MNTQTTSGQLENYKREIAFIVFSRWRIIVGITLGIFAVSVLIIVFWTPIWGAEGTLLVKSKKTDRNPDTLEQMELRQGDLTKEDIYSEMDILVSKPVIQLTLRTLEDQGRIDILSDLGTTSEERLDTLTGMLKAQVSPLSNVIEVRMTGVHKLILVPLLDLVFQTYIGVRYDIFNPVSVGTFVDDQMRRFQSELERKNQEIGDFIAQSGVTAPDMQINNDLNQQLELAKALNQLDADAIDLKSEIDRIDRNLNSKELQLYTFIQVPGIMSFSTKLQEAMAERGNFLRIYKPEADAVRGYDHVITKLNEQLRNEVRAYAESLRDKLVVTEAKIKDYRAKIERIEKDSVKIRQQQLALKSLEQQALALEKSFGTFLERGAQAKLQTQDGAKSLYTYVSILMPPTLLSEPVFPKATPMMAIGLITGLMIGLTIAFILDFQDHTLKRPEQVERVLGLPVLLNIARIDINSQMQPIQAIDQFKRSESKTASA
jgi:uncharacterized protein involved in exopolysaccharide biosynthesis